jgi:carbamoyl-phosphate synthase large subunit
MGFKIYATQHTAEVIMDSGKKGVSVLHKVREAGRKPNIADYIREGKIDLVINIPLISSPGEQEDVLKDEYTIRRLAIEYNIPVLTNLELASALVKIFRDEEDGCELTLRSLNEYMETLSFVNW